MKTRMRRLTAFLVIPAAVTALNSTLSARKGADHLIFPDPNHPLVLVRASGRSGELLIGERLNNESILAAQILRELDLPFHRSVIRLNQCSRNLVSDHAGPNVLYLSQTEGGFPRIGLILQDEGRSTAYPNLAYVDLVLNERNVAEGELDIFSHELGHVMMLNIWKNIPDQKSVKQHVSMGITDYTTAVFEGWGVHFQRLAFDSIAKYREQFADSWDYSRSLGGLWHSNLDKELRINAVLQNRYIHRKQLPGIDTSTLGLEELILLEHTSPLFDATRLRNAQQMLSCEGAMATLFYRININEVLQKNYQNKSFYNRFLLRPAPENSAPQDIFTPFENVILKHFWVWNRLNKSLQQDDAIIIEYIKEWGNSFPEDKEEIFKLFLLTTMGKTMSNELGSVYEKMAYHGMIGEYRKYQELMPDFQAVYTRLKQGLLEGTRLLDANVGPQLWVENPDFLIRRTLWDPERRNPLRMNLNTASAFELSTFPGISLEQARKITAKRDELGYFRSLGEAEKWGFRSSRKN